MSISQIIMMALQLWACLFSMTAIVISYSALLTETTHGRLIIRIEENCAGVALISLLISALTLAGRSFTGLSASLPVLAVLLLTVNVCRRLMQLVDHDLRKRYTKMDKEYNGVWVVYCYIILGFALLISGLNYLNPIVVSLSADGVMVKGELYSFALVLISSFFVVIMIELISELRQFSIYELYMELLFCFIPVFSCLLEHVLNCGSLITSGLAFGAVVMFVFSQMDLLNEKARLKLEKERERRKLIEENTQMMLEQVRPHFLYNSLATIQSLCKENPNEASYAIRHLSSYLRSNLTAIEKRELIPFTEEIELLEHYLSLENMRYEDALMVNYDIQWDRFMIPPMSILSVVEAAFARGLLKNPDGMVLEIRTKHEEGQTVIEVIDENEGCLSEDTGLEIYDGMKKAASRIESLVKGTMDTEKTENDGVCTVIRIPDPASEMEEDQTLISRKMVSGEGL